MNILILQLKRIGDLILTTPAIRCLRDEFPGANLTLVADGSCRDLLPAVAVDEYWVYDRSAKWSGLCGLGPNAWMRTKLPALRPDWCLDFTGTDRATWLAFASGAKRKVTFERFSQKALRKYVFTDFVDSSVRDRHTADHYTDLLSPLGIKREDVPLELTLSARIVMAAQSILTRAGVVGEYAVVHAGTARSEKYWQPDRWARVIDFIRKEYGLQVVLTGSMAAEEQAHITAIRQALVRGDCVDISGGTNLARLAAIIRGAKLFLGVDTAALHIADAMRTPAIGLFGPTNPYHWRPRRTQSIILRPNTTPPFSPSQKGGPMEDISDLELIAALRSSNWLSRPADRAA